MPIPIPLPSEVEQAPVQSPYYLRDPQDWAINQERMRHNQALYMVGEWVVLILMWTQVDFAAGLVQRCSTCFGGASTRQRRVAAVYQQPTTNNCPNCFGTTFEGGYRARIVRPVICSDADESERQSARGTVHPSSLMVESTSDFRSREGDYLFRADGSRWRLSGPQEVRLRTGFAHPTQADDAISYNNIPAKLEQRGTVAYKLPPTETSQLRMILSQPLQQPGDFSIFESVRGPLIPADTTVD